jgi:acetyl-CoA carboxylase biotin carboxyl carrier protein
LARLASEDVRELELRRGGLRVRVAKADGGTGGTSTQPASPRDAAASPPAVERAASAITAPLTGIFYRAPSPQIPPFIEVGSVVNVGDVIGLIEAMKLFNEIRSTAAGRVSRILAENGQLVRAHQPLVELA